MIHSLKLPKLKEPPGVGSSGSMNAPLVDPQQCPGRIFGNDWTIANVAKLLRFNAGQSTLRAGPLTGMQREINQEYLRKTCAQHLPSGVSVALRRDETSNWHAELGFAEPATWNDTVAEEWLAALFLEHRSQVRESTDAGSLPNRIRQFKLTTAD
jgi:hypothetical protein